MSNSQFIALMASIYIAPILKEKTSLLFAVIWGAISIYLSMLDLFK